MAEIWPKTGKKILKNQIIQGVLVCAVLGGVIFCFVFLLRFRIREAGIKKELLAVWESGSWDEAYTRSKTALSRRPMDTFFLTINGFAAYQTALAQVNNTLAQDYLDESIQSLRRSLLAKNAGRDGKIHYVLGKAYYAKGPYYADLAVKFLEEAKAASYEAGDLNEYLGLAYAAVKDYRKSVETFTASLSPDTFLEGSGAEGRDMLLLYIARSYMGLEDWNTARSYLKRCAEITRDSDTALRALLLLGKALHSAGDLNGAAAAFDSVLEKGTENAEASYELGEIYAEQGDTTRARAAWRRARRADPNFAPALARLNAM